ncbi:uncharacterized protein ISCGN_011863 [Ixodes scapularis]
MLSSLRAPTFLLLLCLGALPRASGFSFFGGGGKEDESGSEEDNAIVEHKPSEDGSDVPPWYGDFGFSHDYGMGDEFQNLRGFGKSPDPELDFKEPTKSPEELHEEFFRQVGDLVLRLHFISYVLGWRIGGECVNAAQLRAAKVKL